MGNHCWGVGISWTIAGGGLGGESLILFGFIIIMEQRNRRWNLGITS